MLDLPSLRNETRYGMPAADQVMFNRFFVVGYSYYFRQAKWTLETVDPKTGAERHDNFRSDFRVPPMFRADLADFEGSGFDRGHLVPSANQRETAIQNSETFLLSNMSPQAPRFNRGIWRKLEEAVRDLQNKKQVYETYVISGPLFYFDKPVKLIGSTDDNGVSIPVPNAYFKSVLTENSRGRLHMWSFILPNKNSNKKISEFQVPTIEVERKAGILLWERLQGKAIEREKSRVRAMW
jgi:endonuclease G